MLSIIRLLLVTGGRREYDVSGGGEGKQENYGGERGHHFERIRRLGRVNWRTKRQLFDVVQDGGRKTEAIAG